MFSIHLEAGAADKESVDVFAVGQLCRVGTLDGSAVDDAKVLGSRDTSVGGCRRRA